MSKRDLTQDSIYRHIFTMSFFMMIGLFAHMLLNLVDAIYVSQLGNNESQAVLNYSFPMFYVPFAIFNGLNVGITAILSQKLGAKLQTEAQNILSQCMVLAIVIFAVYFLFFRQILSTYFGFFSIDSIVQQLSTNYLQIIIYGIFLISLSLVLGGALKAEGNMKTLMKAMMLGTLFNLVIDPFLIFDTFHFIIQWNGFNLGVEGAAWATLISDAIIFSIIFFHFVRKKGNFRYPHFPSWKKLNGLWQVLQVSFPAMISQATLGINLAVLTYLLSPYGSDAIAALGIAVRLDIVAVFPALAISTAAISLVGQNYGAKNSSRVLESAKKSFIVGFSVLFCLGIFVYLIKAPLVGLFGVEEAVAKKVIFYTTGMTLSYGFIALSVISGGILQGLGNGIPGMVFVVLRTFGLTFVLAWLLSRVLDFKEYGIYAAPTISNILISVFAVSFTIFYLRRTLKRMRNQ